MRELTLALMIVAVLSGIGIFVGMSMTASRKKETKDKGDLCSAFSFLICSTAMAALFVALLIFTGPGGEREMGRCWIYGEEGSPQLDGSLYDGERSSGTLG